jgi:CRISPR-associated endoribonuclease Cas6
MTTLYSSIIQLRAARACVIPQTQGRFAYAAFLSLVEEADPFLAQALHDAASNKPFTVSQLRGLPQAHDGEIRLRAGHDCWLRVTLAGDDLFQTFINGFLYGDARPGIRLGDVVFDVLGVLNTPGSHPWAGYTTEEELLQQAQAQTSIAFELASPVGFSLGDNRVEIMPRPEVLFTALHKKWSQWCGQELSQPLSRDWLRENVLVSDWQLHSRMLRYGAQAQVGSEGRVTFRVFDGEGEGPEARQLLNVLADFAFYAGVGRKTTQGMGQVRRIVGMKAEG